MEEKYFSQIKEMCGKLYPLNIDYECNNYMEEWNFEN